MQRARAEPIGRDDEDDRDDGDRADAAEACLRRAAALPKVVLHEHLDGALRIGTVRALLAERGIAPPAADEAALARWFDDNAHAGSLERYLEGFALTVAAMASPEALARAAREAAEDALADGAVLAEFRIAPLLFEPFGIAGDAVVEALLAGLAQCPALPCGLIVCALRHLPEAETLRAARLALRWAGRDASGADGSAATARAASATACGSSMHWPTRRAGTSSTKCARSACTSRSARRATCTPARQLRSPRIRSRRCGVPASACRCTPTTRSSRARA